MTENIDKAIATSDTLVWSIMFGLLVVIVIVLKIWEVKSSKEQDTKR